MERQIGKIDPERLKQAKANAPTDPLAPEMLAAVRELFTPEAYEEYVREWTARLADKSKQQSA